MYEAFEDPYCYPGTTVLENRLGIRDPNRLEAAEEEITAERASQPFPAGRLTVTHYRAIHRHLFRDIYAWAGRFRTVRIGKGGSMFCYPEHIPAEMRRVFKFLRNRALARQSDPEIFTTDAAHFLSDLNAIHPFRDGNGRTQLAFLALLAHEAGHPLDLARLQPEPFLAAMVVSFHGDETALRRRLRDLIGQG